MEKEDLCLKPAKTTQTKTPKVAEPNVVWVKCTKLSDRVAIVNYSKTYLWRFSAKSDEKEVLCHILDNGNWLPIKRPCVETTTVDGFKWLPFNFPSGWSSSDVLKSAIKSKCVIIELDKTNPRPMIYCERQQDGTWIPVSVKTATD